MTAERKAIIRIQTNQKAGLPRPDGLAMTKLNIIKGYACPNNSHTSVCEPPIIRVLDLLHARFCRCFVITAATSNLAIRISLR